MANLLQTGAAWLAGQMHDHASRTVTYRDGETAIELKATIGRREVDVIDVDTAGMIRAKSRDFIVTAEDLAVDGEPVEPKEGAVIEEVDDGVTRRWQIMPPAPRLPPWRWSDQYHLRRRLHTKLISEVAS